MFINQTLIPQILCICSAVLIYADYLLLTCNLDYQLFALDLFAGKVKLFPQSDGSIHPSGLVVWRR